MNFLFWKKKPVAENEGEEATRKTVAADDADPKPAKPGWFARLKNALKPSRKKDEDEPDPRAERAGGDNKDRKPPRPGRTSDTEEDESKPVKAGFLTRLKNALSPSRKKGEPDDQDEPGTRAERAEGDHKDHKPPRSGKSAGIDEDESKPAKKGFLVRLKDTLHLSRKKGAADEDGVPERPAKHAGKSAPDMHRKKPGARDEKRPGEEEESEQPVSKSGKKKWLILALLILLIGGSFAAWKWLLPEADHKAPPATAQKTEKPEETSELKPTEAAALTEAAEKAQAEATAMAEAAEKAQAEAAAQAEAVAQAKAEAEAAAQAKVAADQAAAEAQAAAPPASTDANVQAQLETLRKQNQEMQTQLEALKSQRHPPARPAGATASPPRGDVLIINGKNSKESAQGLKQVIEEMNAASGIKREQKPAK